jgi:hypothetical protein
MGQRGSRAKIGKVLSRRLLVFNQIGQLICARPNGRPAVVSRRLRTSRLRAHARTLARPARRRAHPTTHASQQQQ